jgi:hypothetical protein
MFRPNRFRTFALAAALALLSPTGVAFSQCLITGDSSLCNGPVQLCGPEGLYEYLWIDPAGQFSFDRCLTASTPGVYMLRITDEFGSSYGPCSKTVEMTPPPPCDITGPTSAVEGTTVELCGPQGQFTYAWSGPNGFATTSACAQVSVGGTYRLSVWSAGNNCPESMCEHTVTFTAPPPPPPPPPPPADAPANCPRPAWFWLRQCLVSERASTRLDSQQFASVAAAVDAAAGIFSWSNARDGFCTTLHARPATLRACAKRQFATVHANVCAGEMGLPEIGGRILKLDRSTRVETRGVSTTVGEWLAATDARLAQLEPLVRLGRDAREEYRRIIAVGWNINHGRGIGRTCGSRMRDSDGAEIVADFVDDPEEPLASQLMDETDNAPVRALGTPNPFSAATTVTYFVGGTGTQDVAISVYDVAGRKVRELAGGSQSPGPHELRWDGRGADGAQVRSGVYFVRGTIGAQRLAGQLTFLK